MTRYSLKRAVRAGAARPNFLAAMIITSAVGVLVLNFQLEPAAAVSRRNVTAPMITQIPPQVSLNTTSNRTDGEAAGTANGDAVQAATVTVGDICQGRLALLMNLALLEDGLRLLEKQHGYSADFFKQEWLEDKGDYGELTEIQTIELKARHAPFSVYMHWLNGDAGREVLFVDGQNKNKMIVHAGGGGIKSKIPLSLDPNGSLAMSEARHPVTQAGLLNLAKTMVEYRRRDLQAAEGSVQCCLGPDVMFDKRPCYNFTILFSNEEVDADYRKSLVLIDKQWSIPVMVKNYGWYDTEDEDLAQCSPEELDEETFLEYYAFSKINFAENLTSSDFDRDNPDYRF